MRRATLEGLQRLTCNCQLLNKIIHSRFAIFIYKHHKENCRVAKYYNCKKNPQDSKLFHLKKGKR